MLTIALLLLLVMMLLCCCFVIIKTSWPPKVVYLLDFACYKPPASQKASKELIMKQALQSGHFSEQVLVLMKKLLERSGVGDSSYLAEIMLAKNYHPSMKAARREVEMSVFGAVDMLLAKTPHVKTQDIGILIVNCCIYNAVPSLCSIVVNRYKFRQDIITYNLSGMGCSAGLRAIGLAKQLLEVHHKYTSYALVVSTESITENVYLGKDPSKHVINCLFRVGGAAILLSNRPSHANKYQLVHTVHTNTSASDRSYNCILQEEDDAGIVGVTVTKDLLTAAIATIRPNLTTLGHVILPIKEKLVYIAAKVFPMQPYIPDYTKAVEHFLPHVGGKPVLDQLQKTLGFSDHHMEASRMTLYRYGNTSSSSIWYALAYVEAKRRVKKGDRVWQIAFGSGFKCTSVIWRAVKTVDYDDDTNPWTDEISGFPVNLVDCEPLPIYFEQSD